MIIELYGPPGSGKTTFAEAFSREGGFESVKIRSRFELCFRNFLFFLRHPIRFFALFFFIVRYAGNFRLFYVKFTNLFLHVNAKYQKAMSCEKAIIDQGYFQNILSLFEHAENGEVLKKYRRWFLLPDKLIVFDLPTDVLKNRLGKRGYGSRENFSAEYRARWEKAYHENHALLLKQAPKNTLLVRNNADCENVFETLLHPKRRFRYIANSRIPTEKAHGFQIARACEEFAKYDFEVELVIPSRENPITKNLFDFYGVSRNFSVRTISMPDYIRLSHLLGGVAFWLQSLAFVFSLRTLRFEKTDMVYTRNPEVVWFLKHRGMFVVYEAHNWPESKTAPYVFLTRKADVVVCNSKGTEKKFREHGFSRTLVAPNGVDIEKFSAQEKTNGESGELKKSLGIPTDKKIVMYVGQFYRWKGTDTVIEAWKKHFSKRNDVALVLAGGAVEKKNEGNVFFFGHQPHETVPRFLTCADMLLLPNAPTTEESKRYTSPIKMFEYMASRRPIIASDLPSIREILNEKNALFFKAGNADDLAGKIDFLLDNKTLGTRLAMQSVEDVKKYTWENRAKKIVSSLREIIAQGFAH